MSYTKKLERQAALLAANGKGLRQIAEEMDISLLRARQLVSYPIYRERRRLERLQRLMEIDTPVGFYKYERFGDRG